MKRIKGFFLIAIMFIMVSFMFTGCYENAAKQSDVQISKIMEDNSREAVREIGVPAIVNFQELRWTKMIYELRDQTDLVNYAYLFSEYTGKLIYFGRCIGYGIPYSVQMSNPEKYTFVKVPGVTGSASCVLMPQAEPNGLFMPDGLSATWLMMINPETNEITAIYMEPQIVVSPFAIPTAIGNP